MRAIGADGGYLRADDAFDCFLETLVCARWEEIVRQEGDAHYFWRSRCLEGMLGHVGEVDR